jgi:hypothetical protein
MLQSKAGYIDARPHIPQLEEVLLQRTAGPYIGSNSALLRCPLKCPICPKADTARRFMGSKVSCRNGRGRLIARGSSPHRLKFKNPDAPAVKREAEEEWG